MTGVELFIWGLLVLGWIVFQVVRRILKPPRPLGTIQDEAPQPPPVEAPPREAPRRETPLDVEWGRAPVPELPAPATVAPVPWAADRPLPEVATARALARRQAEERRQRQQEAPPQRHPRRPRLRSPGHLRDAVVLTTVLGPCRALQPYESPDRQP